MQGGHGHSHGLGGAHGHSHGGGDDHGHSHGSSSSSKKKKSSKSKKSGGSHAHSLNDDHGHSHGDGSDHGHSHAPVSPSVRSESEYKLAEDEEEEGLVESHGHSHSPRPNDHHENLNVRAAFIHVIGDAIQSIGVMIAAGFIWYNPDWHLADPLCTFLFSILVLFTTTRLIRQSVAVLMEGVPEGITPVEVEDALLGVQGVIAVHDLHIWSLTVGKPSMSVHLYVRDDARHVLAAANKMLAERFNIHHSTIQIERQHDDIHCNDAYDPELAGTGATHLAQQDLSALGLVSPEHTV